MKNIRLMGCLLMAMIGSGQLIAASTKGTEWQSDRIVSLLAFDEGMAQDFLQGKMTDYAVECPAGSCLPLKMIIKGEFLSLDSAEIAPLYLRILKTCYIRYEGKDTFLFSTDLQKWKGFSEFFTGELKASVNSENGGPIAGLELELNQR